MKKKILLVLLILVVLLGIVGVYAYFATDAFKSNKDIFFSYIINDTQNEKLEEYMKKIESTPYTNKGETSIKVNGSNASSSIEDETIQMLNNSKITFEGKTDNSKKLAEQTMTINLSQGINIPVKIRRDDETVGIQSNLLYSKFIALKNDNLKTLLERFGADAENIPDKIDFEKGQFTEEELKTLKDRYTSILYDNLEEKSFTKQKVGDQTIINLDVSDKKCAEILTKILETLRNDDIIQNKVAEMADGEDFKQNIDDAIDEIKNIETSEDNTLNIKLYIQAKDIKKVEITLKDTEDSKLVGTIEISKEENENDLEYIVKVNAESEEDGKIAIDLKIQYKNIKALDNVEENYEINIVTSDTEEGDINMSLKYNNTKTFTTDLEIEGINNDNATILNNATDEELDNLLTSIYENLGLY